MSDQNDQNLTTTAANRSESFMNTASKLLEKVKQQQHKKVQDSEEHSVSKSGNNRLNVTNEMTKKSGTAIVQISTNNVSQQINSIKIK